MIKVILFLFLAGTTFKDVTRRYMHHFHSQVTLYRIPGDWWDKAIASFKPTDELVNNF